MAVRPLTLRPRHDRLTLDTPETQVLMELADLPYNCGFEHTVLLVRLSPTRFVTWDTDGRIVSENLEDEVMIPLARNAPFPAEERHFRVFGNILR